MVSSKIKELDDGSNGSEFSFALDSPNKSLSHNCINYGPIRFYRRQRKAPTLLTGRRSKCQLVDGEDDAQRDLRLQKNRLSAKKLREKRENIEKELIQQIKQLEQERFYLEKTIWHFNSYKQKLIEDLEDAKQDPLFNLINNSKIPLFFQQADYSSIDTGALLNNLNDEFMSLDSQSIELLIN